MALEVLALELNLPDLRGVDIDATLLVGDHGITRETVPQPVADLHVLVGLIIARVMIGLGDAERAKIAAYVAGHDIPGDAAAGQVVERAEAPHGEKGRRACGG